MDGSDQEDRDLKVSIPRSGFFLDFPGPLGFFLDFSRFFSGTSVRVSWTSPGYPCPLRGILALSGVSLPYADILALCRVSWTSPGFPGLSGFLDFRGSWTSLGIPRLSQGFLEFLIVSRAKKRTW
jgi:hypothetical protein